MSTDNLHSVLDSVFNRASRAFRHEPADIDLLRDRLAAAGAALKALEAALAEPFVEIEEPAQCAYHAALELALVAAEQPAIEHTAARMLEVLEPYVTPQDRALREATFRAPGR